MCIDGVLFSSCLPLLPPQGLGLRELQYPGKLFSRDGAFVKETTVKVGDIQPILWYDVSGNHMSRWAHMRSSANPPYSVSSPLDRR